MTKFETSILESKTPEDYIDRSLKARLPPAAKAKLARHWMETTGYTKEDILRARNRHPYWKRKKMEGSADRTRRRLAAHDYSGGSSVQWDQALVAEFLGLNGKDAEGHYEQKDWQLAERFNATIPSIQYMRRKCSKVEALLGARASQAKMVEYLLHAESVLSRGRGAVEEFNSGRKTAASKKAAPKRAAPKKAAPKKAPARPAKASPKVAKAGPRAAAKKPAQTKAKLKPKSKPKASPAPKKTARKIGKK